MYSPVSWLILDQLDSFTYNLAHLCHQVLLQETGTPGNIKVVRPHEISLDAILNQPPDAVLLSPGPGGPQDSRMAQTMLDHMAGRVPLFGVCLGMQTIAHWAGANVIRGEPVHGKRHEVTHQGAHPMLAHIPSPFTVVRYHSLHVDPTTLTGTHLVPLAWSRDRIPMALAWENSPADSVPVWGVQFHPESIGSTFGLMLLTNFYRAASKVRFGSIMASRESLFSRQ
jgi:anthranilate synthase/aminodeoxychorismate synthase-like glutamine amidotransferase